MPFYEYVCDSCGHQFETMQSINAKPLTTCEKCGAEIRRIIFPSAIVYKGSGFYSTEYGNSRFNNPTVQKAESTNNSEKSSASSETSSEKPTSPANDSDSKKNSDSDKVKSSKASESSPKTSAESTGKTKTAASNS